MQPQVWNIHCKCETECDQCAWVNSLIQRGATTFYLRVISQNVILCGPLPMYKTTDSQDLKLKKGRHVSASLKLLHNSQQPFITNLHQWHACSRSFYDTTVPLEIPVLVAASRRMSCFVCYSISIFTVDLTCFIVQNVRIATYVCVSKRWAHFSAKSFSLGNLSLLTNVRKLFSASNTVSIVAYVFIKRCYACSTVIRITYCRDGQLIWLKGHFEKIASSW